MSEQLALIPQAMMPSVPLVMHGPQWHRIHVWTVRYRIVDDGAGGSDAEEMSAHLQVVTVDPDEYDTEDGYDTPAKEGARYIRTALYIWGPYATNTHPPRWGAGTWYAAEPYQDPYLAEYEEVTVHPEGFTDAEAVAMHDLIIKPWEN